MHEYGLMQRTVESILRDPQARSGRVEEVILHVGELEVHSQDSLQQAWEMMTRGTALEGVKLRLILVQGELGCACGYRGPVHREGTEEYHDHDPMPYAECPGCGALNSVQGGRGVDKVELVMA